MSSMSSPTRDPAPAAAGEGWACERDAAVNSDAHRMMQGFARHRVMLFLFSSRLLIVIISSVVYSREGTGGEVSFAPEAAGVPRRNVAREPEESEGKPAGTKIPSVPRERERGARLGERLRDRLPVIVLSRHIKKSRESLGAHPEE
ncbi:hypothetical protein SKAU_G00303600 [Synaphobranchus kaupii]|uniref:Uncharacterized protein n=1 Tax=Synaphobranchus kaupii TaxID=118154 RepID=A0A9Q1IMJ5_SYNKA|nr:hypothetical protein SKAU_G00303600 [Synaphobranchus kaupii]